MSDKTRSPYQSIPWFGDIQGVAYRYYDLRMTVVPLVPDMDQMAQMWRDTIYWWLDHTIKIRFVESGDAYWFIMGAQTRKPASNLSFYKMNLPMSENYKRFKQGHDGEAYLRLGVYERQDLEDAKKDAICDCGHIAKDHDENDYDVCLYNSCDCKKFASFQVTLSRRKKTVTDIEFVSESDEESVKNDPLVWNCLYAHKYSKED